MPWEFSSADDIGGRVEQQDRLLVLHCEDARGHFAVVADGAGGHGDGALAAQTVIDLARQRFDSDAFADPESFLEQLCFETHQALVDLQGDTPGINCSTCVFLLLRDREAYWAHVGDSRLYLLRGNCVMQRTIDHSLIQLQAEGKVEADAKVSANQLYMCLGASGDIVPQTNACSVSDNDTFLLCSDGFWGPLDIEETITRLADADFESSLAQDFVQRAKGAAGAGGDNISLVLARLCARRAGPATSLLGYLLALFGRRESN